MLEGKRKLIFAIISLFMLYLLARVADLSDDAISSMFWGVMLMFGGGNLGEHYAKKGQNNAQNPIR